MLLRVGKETVIQNKSVRNASNPKAQEVELFNQLLS